MRIDLKKLEQEVSTWLADGLAEEHHWVPNSGWVTFSDAR